MRSPKIILENLQKHSYEDNYKYEKLYRNLYNPEFYLQAYQNIYANKGAMTSGIDGMTLDGFGKDVVENLILQIKNHTYQPNPVKRVYIPKKNGKKRPLGISSSADKLVQEWYWKVFMNQHFQNVHTVLDTIKVAIQHYDKFKAHLQV